MFGGAVYTLNATVKDCEFSDNSALHGASVYAIDKFNDQSNIPEDEIQEAQKNNIVPASSVQEGYFINLTNGYYGSAVNSSILLQFVQFKQKI